MRIFLGFSLACLAFLYIILIRLWNDILGHKYPLRVVDFSQQYQVDFSQQYQAQLKENR